MSSLSFYKVARIHYTATESDINLIEDIILQNDFLLSNEAELAHVKLELIIQLTYD